jgi:hypothetical protein
MIRNLGWMWHRWSWCLFIPSGRNIHRSSVIISHLDFILLIPCTRLTAGVRARTSIRVSFTTKTKRNFNSNNFYNSSASFSLPFRSPVCSTSPPLPTLHLELVNLIEMAKLWFSMLQRLFIPQKRKPRWNLELAVLSLWVARQVPSLSAFVTPKLLYL